jgi:hypothetical protein
VTHYFELFIYKLLIYIHSKHNMQITSDIMVHGECRQTVDVLSFTMDVDKGKQ